MNRYGEMLVFVRAVADGGFSAAARSLSLTPSAVSKLIARMENRLGVSLFDRSRRTVTLTPEAKAFHDAALRAIDAMEETDAAVLGGGATRDTLRIRLMPTFAVSQLAPLIPRFRMLHPALRLELHLKIEPGNILDGGIDVAIHVGHLADSSMVAHRFASTRWIICAAPGYIARHGAPTTPDELGQHECLNFVPSNPASIWRVKGTERPARRIKISSSIVTNQGQMLLELARAGVGIVRLAEYHIRGDLRSGSLVELFPDQQSQEQDPIYAVYQSKRHLSHRVRVFLDFLDSSFADDGPVQVDDV